MQNIEDILKSAGIEGEQAEGIAKAVKENYKTVAEVEQKTKKLTDMQTALDSANKALEEVKANAEDSEALKAKLAEYEQAAKKREEEDAAAKSKAAFDTEFTEGLSGKKFANSVVADAIKAKAYQLRQANADMPIADIIKLAAPDESGIWENPQQTPHKMPAGNGAADGMPSVTSLDQLRDMKPEDINKHWDEVQKILANA